MPGAKVIPIIFAGIMFFAAAATAQQPVTPPAAYNNNIKVNYVRSWEATAPEEDPAILVTRPLKDVKQTTSYFDGLARLLQTVKKEASLANGRADLVTPVIYDAFGRETYRYAPFAANGTGGNLSTTDGLFKLNPFQQQVSFYNNQMTGQPDERLVGPNQLNWAYSQTVYEASSLNRAETQMAPGSSWVGGGRGVVSKHWFNTAADEVRMWQVDDVPGGMGNYKTPADNGAVYAAGALSKIVSVNEAGKQLIEFKDKEGQLILRKQQLTAANDNGSGSNHNGWLCTYYLYDDLNNLRCVIQPAGVEWLVNNNWNINAPGSKVIDEQCFLYAYDARNRPIIKKAPGAGAIQMVYDTRDRLVLMQDANMAQPSQMQWLVTTYDELNRPVATYKITDAANYNNAGYYRNSSANLATLLSGLNNNDLLTETHYDSYAGIPADFSTSSLYASGYGSFLDAAPGDYPDPVTVSTATKGLVTWTRIRVQGENKYITSCNLYDKNGRVIQTQTINYTGAMDVVTNQYSFSGQLLRSHMRHQKGVTAIQTFDVGTKNVYDDLGRLVAIEKNLSGLGWKQIAAMTYDALGQLKTKKLAPSFNNSAGLETLTYDYNIRGWMLGINKSYLSSNSSTSSHFGMELSYDKDGYAATANKQYNGNTGSTVWRSQGDGERRKYDFSYDAANRLLKADFNQQFGSQWAKADPGNSSYRIDFSTHMGDGVNATSAYDANGNIIQMQQWGLKLNNSPQIDNLTYNYLFNGNKLARVTDGFSDPNTKLGDFKDGNNAGTDDYSYDANGNILMDNNKAISSIAYNYLNLPQVVTIAGKGTITYTYDAAGNKLKKETVDNTVTPAKTTTTLYIGGFVYENDVLQFVNHEEGRIRFTPANGPTAARFDYDYFIKDHLGNVRMVLTDEQKQDIYPAATLENVTYNNGTAISAEDDFYNIDPSKVVDQAVASGIPAYSNNNGIYNNNYFSNTTANSARLYKLNASGNTPADKTGLGIILKVMTGDAINIFGKSYHKMPVAGYTSSVNGIIVSELINGFAGTSLISTKGVTGSQITGQPGFPTSLNQLIGNQPDQNTNRPKAAINWIIFDEQFKAVGGGFDMVGAATNPDGTFKTHDNNTIPTIAIPENGYIYVYCSNESQYDVFFDNLQVVHIKGPLIEETHYYPFGLTMAGISSRAAGTTENKKEKFNGAELNTDFDLNIYEFHFRTYDPQVGRWHGLDTKPTDMISSYAAMANNPIRYADPLGDTLALFRPDGTFWKFQDDGKKEFSGMFYQTSTVTSTYEKDGVQYEVRTYSNGQAFNFNDPAVDVLAIKNGVESGGRVGITRVENMSDALVEKRIDASGVRSAEAQARPMRFANKQGRQGNMDYGVQGINAGDLKPNTFYIRGSVAYNVGDIGNYLFGRGMAELGIQLGTTSIGAHLNNMNSWRKGNGDYTPKYDFGPGTYGKPGLFDSQGDQRAIISGFLSTPKGVALWHKELYEGLPTYNPK